MDSESDSQTDRTTDSTGISTKISTFFISRICRADCPSPVPAPLTVERERERDGENGQIKRREKEAKAEHNWVIEGDMSVTTHQAVWIKLLPKRNGENREAMEQMLGIRVASEGVSSAKKKKVAAVLVLDK